jgi:Ca2+:H+ antiporter
MAPPHGRKRIIARWPIVVPVAAIAMLAVSYAWAMSGLLAALCGIALIGGVVAAVHHAEVVAHRIGEPFGTLVLAIAVTVIEASLIISLILGGGPYVDVLVRDTVYATVMIIATGVIGLCSLLGSIRHHEQQFRIDGAGPAFAALAALAVLVLVMPAFTVSAPGARYTTAQLAFVSIGSLLLWCVFVFFQTISHRDYFLPPGPLAGEHAPPPTAKRAWQSLALLLVALTAVILLAKQLSPTIESAVNALDAPRIVVGIAVALLVLMPESIAAARAALANRLQTSVNLALGSALATIGLTVPVVVAVCIAFDLPIVLGIDQKDIVLLVLTLLTGAIGIATGRTNLMYGAVQLLIFTAFLFLALVP